MSFVENIKIIGPLTAFGRVDVSEDTPKIQFHSVYGIPNTAESFTQLGGTVGTDAQGFFCSTGTTNSAFAVIRSKNSIIYKPGEGAILTISAIFDTPVADSRQRAGAFSVTDAAMFSYEETGDFGVYYQHSGALEIQTLTITTPAGGGENATITLDGTPYTVALTAGTVQHNAFEITEDLNVQAAGIWQFSQNDDQVIAIALIDEDKIGSFAFSSATAVAAWVETRAGVTSTKTAIIQANWDNQPVFDFDPTFRNVYAIQYQYLGYGDIKFFIAIPGTNAEIFQLVHTVENLNTPGNLNFSNPSMNAGWLASSEGSTTDVTIHGGSIGYFVQGKNMILSDAQSESNEKTIGTTETNIISIRNRQVFGGKQSKAEIVPFVLSIGHEGNKLLKVRLIRNATLGGEPNWQYVDENASIAEFDTSGTTISGGIEVRATQVRVNGDKELSLTGLIALAINETLTVTGRYVSGAAAAVDATLTWKENT
jgi:hypothetical protein